MSIGLLEYFRIDLFGVAPNICHTFPAMMRPGTVIPYLLT